MRRILRKFWSIAIVAGTVLTIGTIRAQGQNLGMCRSLGGYGATSTSAMAGMGSSSPMIPYAGSFGGFMPYRMASGAGSGLSFSSRGTFRRCESSRTSFSLAPMSARDGDRIETSHRIT